MARALAPTMVVLEDVDLIAQERGQPFQPTGPLLFELLNEMDGLRGDCDESAMDELSAGGQLAQRILGFRPTEQTAPELASATVVSTAQPSGFPPVAWSVRVDNPH